MNVVNVVPLPLSSFPPPAMDKPHLPVLTSELVASVAPLAFQYQAVVVTLAIGVPALWLGLAVAAHKGHLLEGVAQRTGGPAGRVIM